MEYVDDTQLGNNDQNSVPPQSNETKGSKTDVESKVEEIEIETPFRHFSFRRLQAIGALFALIGASLLPLFLIGGSLCSYPLTFNADYQWRRFKILVVRTHIHGSQWSMVSLLQQLHHLRGPFLI
jgi:hypothetical protein